MQYCSAYNLTSSTFTYESEDMQWCTANFTLFNDLKQNKNLKDNEYETKQKYK